MKLYENSSIASALIYLFYSHLKKKIKKNNSKFTVYVKYLFKCDVKYHENPMQSKKEKCFL